MFPLLNVLSSFGRASVRIQSVGILESRSTEGNARIVRLRNTFKQYLPAEIDLKIAQVDMGNSDEVSTEIALFEDAPNRAFLAMSGYVTGIAVERFRQSPVFFLSHNDPVFSGYVKSLDRPGFARSGLTYFSETWPSILLNLNKLSRPTRVAVLTDSIMVNEASQRLTRLRATFPQLHPVPFVANKVSDLADALTSLVKLRINAVIVQETLPVQQSFELFNSELIQAGIVGVYSNPVFSSRGGLMAYVGVVHEPYAIWARQIRMMLDGVPIAEIPVESPREFRLHLNLDSAREMGLDLPGALIRAAYRTHYREPHRASRAR
jgi:putative tryptophan/tyrosine transport system substrate-binding protein